MTKKEMIEIIQQREAEAFLQVKVDEAMFGMNSTITTSSRSEWAKINGLMEDLGIKPNNLLPENQKAIALIIDKTKKEVA
jgi:hypothetical protein